MLVSRTKTVYLTLEELKQLDDWRRMQPKIPSLSAAIRTLVNLALQDKEKK